MVEQKTLVIGMIISLVVVGGVVTAAVLLGPKPTIQADDPFPDGGVVVASGDCTGDGGHTTSGKTMWIRKPDDSYVMRFEDFEQVTGPDVFHYIVKSDDACTPCDSGLFSETTKVKIASDAEGHAVKRGNFNHVLPSSFVPSNFTHSVQWCEQYSVQFGHCEMVFV